MSAFWILKTPSTWFWEPMDPPQCIGLNFPGSQGRDFYKATSFVWGCLAFPFNHALSQVYINTLSGNIFQYYQKVSNITRKYNEPVIMVILQPFTWIKSENFTPHITFHPSWLSELTRRHSGWKVIFGVKFYDFIQVKGCNITIIAGLLHFLVILETFW